MYQDIVYMRFMKQGRVIRVARVDTQRGLVLALYPTEDRDVFLTESFQDIDDHSNKEPIERDRIKDKVWLNLLDGKSHKVATRGYRRRGSDYSYGCSIRSREFRIAPDKEEN